ncbi:MAG: hypothetical protein K2K89_11650 [Ruminococcus sp.]|nr:hypothetical protein [Ruminococcus sp.]
MNDELRKRIYNSLKENNLLKTWTENIHETEEVVYNTNHTNDDDITTAPDGTQYYKSLVIKYLTEKGYPLTQENINLSARMFQANGATYTRNNYRTIERDEFENIPDEDIDVFLYSKILEQLAQLNAHTFMDYAVESVRDTRSGGTNFDALAKILRKRSETGWRLVNTFTNEIGVNSTSVTIGNYTGGTNATIDQIVMIFERPMSMTDKKAQEIINQIRSNS